MAPSSEPTKKQFTSPSGKLSDVTATGAAAVTGLWVLLFNSSVSEYEND
jgi:hypothetical protein